MTFDQFETSTQANEPIELYDFAVGVTHYTFTSSQQSVVFGGFTYEPATGLTRTRVVAGSERNRETLIVTMPSDSTFASLFVGIIPGQLASLTVRRLQRQDIGVGDEGVLLFKGKVRTVSYQDDGQQTEVGVQPLLGEFDKEGPRFGYQSLCNHILYDSRCKVLENSFRFIGSVSSIATTVYTVPGLNAEVDQYYRGGFVQHLTTDFRLIVSHTGNDVDLLLPFRTDLTGETVSVFAGCDHSATVCQSKFNNLINFGGFKDIPNRDPFRRGFT